MVTNIFRLLISISIFASFQALALSNISASVSQNPVSLNESVDLILAVDDKVEANIFDFSVLEEDFRVLGTSVSSETRMINFDTTRITRFTTRLMPKKTGNLIIPAFVHQGISSKPITLIVSKQSSHNEDNSIFVETELSQDSVWLQQQVNYTTRLYLSVQISSGSLTQPEIQGAVIEQEGKDKEYDKILNGVAYRVIERTYKIIPQRSGEFVIDSPVFQAEVLDNSRRQFGFNRTKTISRIGNSQTLTVKAIPDEYSGHWLPSELVMLHDELEPKQLEYFVGEPITRVITLSALDVSPDQLPEIKANYPASVKVYPDQADTHSSLRDGQYISQRIETQALIPSQTGELVLPAITINWWDTQSEKMRQTTLDSKTIKVIANPNSPAQPQPLVPVSQNAEQTQTENEQNQADCEPQIIEKLNTHPWQFGYLTALFLALWILTLIALLVVFFKNKQSKMQKPDSLDERHSEKLAWSRLIKACQKNNIEQIQSQLPVWVEELTQTKVASCYQALNALNNSELTQQVQNMQASRFSQQTNSWQADKLTALLKTIRQQKLIKAKQDNNLSPLNP